METNQQYSVRQPKRLETLAIVKLGDWIATQAEKLMSTQLHANRILQVIRSIIRTPKLSKADDSLSRHVETIRQTFESNIPRVLHDKLAIQVIQALSQVIENIKPALWSMNRFSHRKVIWRMTETLFTQNLTFLILNIEMLRTSLRSKLHRLTSLTRLELYPTLRLKYCSTVDESNIIQTLKILPGLKYLTIQDICSDNILKGIVENSKLLEVLSLIFSKRINDKSIDLLTELPNLRSINLDGTEVGQRGIETLLISCKNIGRISISPDILVCAIENIVSLEGNTEKRFMIKSFENDYNLIPLKQLQLIVQTCPHIQKMTLLKIQDQILQSYLITLTDLEDLYDLELHNYNFFEDQLDKVLGVRGCNLVHLHLVGVEQIDLSALQSIYRTCLSMECLGISQCTFRKESVAIKSQLDYESPVSPILPLRNLKRLTLHAENFIELLPTEEQLLFLLSNCPNVEFVKISDIEFFTDDIMLKVLENCPWIYLKEFKIWRNKLTKLVIDRIVQNCIAPPEVIIVE